MGPLWPPLRAGVSARLSALVSLWGGRGRPSFPVTPAGSPRDSGGRGAGVVGPPCLVSLNQSAAEWRPAEGVRAPGPRGRLPQGLRPGGSRRPRLSPLSRAAGVPWLRAPSLGFAQRLARVGLVSPARPSSVGAIVFPPGDVRPASASLTCAPAAECGRRVHGKSVGQGGERSWWCLVPRDPCEEHSR